MRRVWITSEAYDAAIGTVVAARHAQKLTQRDLADRLGKPRSFVSKLETKERRLDVVAFVVVARALRVLPEELLKTLIESLPETIEI